MIKKFSESIACCPGMRLKNSLEIAPNRRVRHQKDYLVLRSGPRHESFAGLLGLLTLPLLLPVHASI